MLSCTLFLNRRLFTVVLDILFQDKGEREPQRPRYARGLLLSSAPDEGAIVRRVLPGSVVSAAGGGSISTAGLVAPAAIGAPKGIAYHFFHMGAHKPIWAKLIFVSQRSGAKIIPNRFM